MGAYHLDRLIDLLPKGRSRSRYERLAGTGDIFVVTVPYLDGPLWLVGGTCEVQALISVGEHRSRILTFAEVQEFIWAFGSRVHSLQEAATLFVDTERTSGL